ncbi:hypothetical protein GQ457_04G024720 [Hibiscus cannabinus]
MQQISVGRSGKTANKPPMLLQHRIFVVNHYKSFDVWLSNTCGTKYSSGHTSMSPNDSVRSFIFIDELIQYGLSILVQYVNSETRQKLHYGTLIALASFSQQDKLIIMFRLVALLSPIAHLNQIQS